MPFFEVYVGYAEKGNGDPLSHATFHRWLFADNHAHESATPAMMMAVATPRVTRHVTDATPRHLSPMIRRAVISRCAMRKPQKICAMRRGANPDARVADLPEHEARARYC